MSAEKIEFHAVLTKRGGVLIVDQHGREIDGEPDVMRTNGRNGRVVVGVELEAPWWPLEPPHATISIRVPLEVEERLPGWMQELLNERGVA